MTRCTCHVHATERPGGPPALNLVRSDDCPVHGTEAERKREERWERAEARGWDASVWARVDSSNPDTKKPAAGDAGAG